MNFKRGDLVVRISYGELIAVNPGLAKLLSPEQFGRVGPVEPTPILAITKDGSKIRINLKDWPNSSGWQLSKLYKKLTPEESELWKSLFIIG